MPNEVRRLHVSGLGPIRDLSVEFGRTTLVFGGRGVGKTSLLRSLRLVTFARSGSLQRFAELEPMTMPLIHEGHRSTAELKIDVELRHGDKSNRYGLRLTAEPTRRLRFIDEVIGYQRMRFSNYDLMSLGAGHFESKLREHAKSGHITAKVINYHLSKLAIYSLSSPPEFGRGSWAGRPGDDKFLRTNGSNLAPFLARLAGSEHTEEREAFTRINQWFSRLVPRVRRILPVVEPLPTPLVRLDFIGDDDAAIESRLTDPHWVRVVALVTALSLPKGLQANLVCVDDLELGLDAASVKLVMDLARLAANETQLLLTTESRLALSCFRAEEVVVMTRHHGESVATRPNATELAQLISGDEGDGDSDSDRPPLQEP